MAKSPYLYEPKTPLPERHWFPSNPPDVEPWVPDDPGSLDGDGRIVIAIVVLTLTSTTSLIIGFVLGAWLG